MSRTVRLISVATVAAAILAAIYLYRDSEPVTAPSYATVPVERGALIATVSATGTLNPLITVQVGSQVSGTIEKLNADFNSRVKKGEVIAQIEPSLFEAQVAQAEANLASATASAAKAEVAIEDAKRELARMTHLRSQRMVSAKDLDTAQFAYKSALADAKVREAAVAQAKAALQQAKVNLAHTTIYAPIDGVVLSRDVDVGQTVAASFQAPTIYTIAQDLTRMQIATQVDEAFIGRVKAGEAATFTVFAYPGRTFRGEVAQVRLNPTVESGVVKYDCIIHVDNKDLALKPGMTATVAIEVAQRKNVLKVPNTALRYIPELPASELAEVRAKLKSGQAVLWEPENGTLKPVIVRTGLVGERETEVSGDGVHEGMDVAVPPGRAAAGGRRHGHGLRLF